MLYKYRALHHTRVDKLYNVVKAHTQLPKVLTIVLVKFTFRVRALMLTLWRHRIFLLRIHDVIAPLWRHLKFKLRSGAFATVTLITCHSALGPYSCYRQPKPPRPKFECWHIPKPLPHTRTYKSAIICQFESNGLCWSPSAASIQFRISHRGFSHLNILAF